MATYTATQLYGTGSIGENLSGASTFTFTNPGDSSYFTLETIPNATGSYAGAPLNASGSWVVSQSMGFVSSSYVASVVVQPGSSALTFTPAASVTGTTYRLRGTGVYSLIIGSGGGGGLLLDTYSGAFAAYSLRKLNTAYTGSVIRVRRSSDNTETDIGFVSNVLDTASLLTFCGAGSGFVTTWYDQSGNARNQTQITAANQPQIVSSGSVITVNGKPAYSLNGTSQYLNLSVAVVGSNLSIIQVFKINDNTFITNFGGSYIMFGFTSSFPADNVTVNSRYKNNVLLSTTDALQVTASYGNNTQILSSGYYGAVNMNSIGFGNSTTYPLLGNCQELIIYLSDQSANNNGINTNINSFYSIY